MILLKLTRNNYPFYIRTDMVESFNAMYNIKNEEVGTIIRMCSRETFTVDNSLKSFLDMLSEAAGCTTITKDN